VLGKYLEVASLEGEYKIGRWPILENWSRMIVGEETRQTSEIELN
jgi:hypothetical protein